MLIFTRFVRQTSYFASHRRLLWVAPLVVLLATTPTVSGAIVDTLGFESPLFVLGTLEGQQGWEEVSSGPGLGNGTAVVQSSIIESGNQAVQVTRAAQIDNRWALPVVPFFPLPQRIIQIDWDMYVTQAQSNNSFGPFIGVEAYDGTNNIADGLTLGSLGVDTSTNDVLYQIEDTGYLTETGTTVDFNEWHHFQIRLNFDTDNYAAFVDDGLVASTGFVDRGMGLDKFTDADISALAAAADGSSQAATVTAYFDNFLVQEVNGADFDGDGDVDGTDFLVWQRGYGISGTALPSDGDANGDLDVDADDLAIWQSQFGYSSSAVSVATVVPEPATLGLLILAGLTLGMLRSARER